MCGELDKKERLAQMAHRALMRHRLSLRERLSRHNEEVLRLRENLHISSRNCSRCNDEDEVKRLIKEIEHEAWSVAIHGEYEVKRTFTSVHYELPCAGDSCAHGRSPMSLHGVKTFLPSKLKGVAKLLYEELVGPEMNFTVSIFETSNAMIDSFRFKISWAKR